LSQEINAANNASPWSAPWAVGSLLPSFCTDLGVCRAVPLTYSHSPLYPAAVFSPPSSLCYPRGATTITDGLGLGLDKVRLGASGIGSNGHGGSFQQLLTEVASIVPLISKPGHASPIHRHILNPSMSPKPVF